MFLSLVDAIALGFRLKWRNQGKGKVEVGKVEVVNTVSTIAYMIYSVTFIRGPMHMVNEDLRSPNRPV